MVLETRHDSCYAYPFPASLAPLTHPSFIFSDEWSDNQQHYADILTESLIYGRVLTLTATVMAGATGTVTFYDGAIVLGTGRVVAGAASLSTPTLAAGTRRLTAYYRGDSNFTASSSAVLTHTVQAVGGNVFATTTYTDAVFEYANARAVADFNGDGKPDLIWAGTSGVGILPGNGDGTFQTPRVIPSGFGAPGAHPVAISDFNGDGIPDLAFAVARHSPWLRP